MRLLTLPLVSCLLLIAACAHSTNLRNAEAYYGAGLRASRGGEHTRAAVLLSRAYGNAKLGGAKDDALSMTMYGYGRELALLGGFEEAELMLTESLELQREVEPLLPVEILRRTSVLGRVYLDTGRPDLALPLLLEARDLAGGLPPGEVPPADTMYLLKDIVAAGEEIGDETELRGADQELARLRAEHGDIEPDYAYERYTQRAISARRETDPGLETKTEP